MQKQHTHTHTLPHTLWPVPLFLGRKKRAIYKRQLFEGKALMIYANRLSYSKSCCFHLNPVLCILSSRTGWLQWWSVMRCAKMEQGVLAAAPPVCASEDYMMRKPPHQRNRGDSNCKESLSARSYYIKRIYQRGIFFFFYLPCFYIVLPFF